MPFNEDSSLSERVAAYCENLSAAAKDLNAVSDELGKSISEIDSYLRALNLGIVAWLDFRGGSGSLEQGETWYWNEGLGYDKVGGKWGICIRRVSGDVTDPDNEQSEIWSFGDAPRELRLLAIDYVADLLDKLTQAATATTQKLEKKLANAHAVAKGVKSASTASTSKLRLRAITPTVQRGVK